MLSKILKLWNEINKNREIKNASWLIGGKVIQMLLSLIISIISARYLGPSNYGLINYAGAYTAFFSSLCTLGLNYVIIKNLVDNTEDQGKTIGTSIGIRCASSALSSLAILGIVCIIDRDEPLTIMVTFLSSLSLVFQSFDTINYWFQSRYQSKITSVATLLAYIVTSIYRIILLALGKDVLWFAFATSVDSICMSIFLWMFYKRSKGPKLSFSWKKGKALLKKSYHYILSGMMVAIYGQTDKLMLKQMLDETAVGFYSLAFSINLMWVFVLQAIIDSMYPTIMRLYNEDYCSYQRKNRQLYAIVIYISFVVAIGFTLFGKFFVIFVYGEQYAGAVEPLKIITWYTMFSYLGVARNAWLVCENKQKYLKYMYGLAAVVNVVLNYTFIPVWGASGAAIASLITQICTCILLPATIKDMRPNVKLMLEALILKEIK